MPIGDAPPHDPVIPGEPGPNDGDDALAQRNAKIKSFEANAWPRESLSHIEAHTFPRWIPLGPGGRQVPLSLNHIHDITDGDLRHEDAPPPGPTGMPPR